MTSPEDLIAQYPELSIYAPQTGRPDADHLARFRAELEQRVRTEALFLPPLPETAMRLVTMCQDDGTAAGEIQDTIAEDQALCARILSVANSAAYSGVVEVSSVQLAVSRLGFSFVRDIALAEALRQQFRLPGWETEVDLMWRRSATNAAFAREIARIAGSGLQRAGLYGILQDVGRPITLYLLQRATAETGLPLEPPVAEQLMDEYHSAIGGAAAQSWGLPDWVREVIHYHHRPQSAGSWAQEATVAHLADRFAGAALGLAPSPGPTVDEIARFLGVRSADLVELGGRARGIVESAESAA